MAVYARLRPVLLTLVLLVPMAAAAVPLLPGQAETRAHAAMAGTPPDWAEAQRLFLIAADAGSVPAMTYLGWMAETGRGQPVDPTRAAHWYRRAAEAGAMPFAVKLGWMHLAGQGVQRDRQQAEDWFRFAIENGHTAANVALASILIGDALGAAGRFPDPQTGAVDPRAIEAERLLQAAMEDGQPHARYFLYRLHAEGIGGYPVNLEQAAVHARAGAEGGLPALQSQYAQLLMDGLATDSDPLAAGRWARQAALANDPLGIQLWRSFREQASAEDLSRIEHRIPDRPGSD